MRKFKKSNIITEVVESTREDTDLFSLEETKRTIKNTSPDLIINAAAKSWRNTSK